MGKNRQGIMLGFEHVLWEVKDCHGNLRPTWSFVADYASGKNSIGGGGVSVKYFFTPKISVLTGPVWFNDASINGTWKWSVQFDVDW